MLPQHMLPQLFSRTETKHAAFFSFVPLPVPAAAPALFVDGGNNELFAAPDFTLQLFRVASIQFSGKKQEKSAKAETLVLVKGSEISYLPLQHPKPATAFPRISPLLSALAVQESPAAFAILARQAAELSFAAEQCRHLTPGSCLVLDGCFEFPEALGAEAKALLEAQSIFICGLSKTSELQSNGSSIHAQLAAADPGGTWSVQLSSQNGIAHYILKLHPKARHFFRVDVPESQDTATLFSCLAHHATDPAFFGYPYGLIAVDKLARVTNEEALYCRTKLEVQLGRKYGELAASLNALNAHAVLDQLAFAGSGFAGRGQRNIYK